MRISTFSKLVASVGTSLAVCAAFGAGTAVAASPVPLVSQWRACDFTLIKWPDATGAGRPISYTGSTGDGTMVAKVDIVTARLNTAYTVKVVQVPRPSKSCAPGDPGVLSGILHTDGTGAGSVTLQGPVAEGKTGAWIAVELPSPTSQTPEEFYTSTALAAI